MTSSDPLDELHSAIERNNVKQVARLIANGVVPEIRSLFFAIKCRANEIVKLLIEALPNVNDPEPYWKKTPLVRAIECKNQMAVKMLLDAGASPNKGGRSDPPLVAAAENGFLEGAKLLIAAGANLEQRSSPAQMTPLIVAAQMGHVEVVKLLLEAGANPLSVDILDRTAYDIAVEAKEEEVAKLLAPLSSGKKPRPKSPLELLLDAIKRQDAAAFDKCLATGLDVNKRDRFGWSPLDCAIDVGSVEFVRKLIKAGAEVNVESEGISPLEAALHKERPDIAEILLKAGAVPKALTPNSADPFLTACTLGYVDLVKLFIESGADPNASDNWGETALMSAVGTHGSVELVRLLISNGAEVERPDKEGRTALFHAVLSNLPVRFVHVKFPSGSELISAEPLERAQEDPRQIEIVKFLLDHGADVNRRDNKGRTPLTYAYTPGVANVLIQAGARLDIRDKRGHDVVYWLKKNGIVVVGGTAQWLSTADAKYLRRPVRRRSAKRRRF